MPADALTIRRRIRHLLSRAQRLDQRLRYTGSLNDDRERQHQLWNDANRCRARARLLQGELNHRDIARDAGKPSRGANSQLDS